MKPLEELSVRPFRLVALLSVGSLCPAILRFELEGLPICF